MEIARLLHAAVTRVTETRESHPHRAVCVCFNQTLDGGPGLMTEQQVVFITTSDCSRGGSQAQRGLVALMNARRRLQRLSNSFLSERSAAKPQTQSTVT